MRLAFQFAMESDSISADSVEVTGYGDLVRKYRISGVPKTVVGDVTEFVGAGPEAMLLQHVQKAASTSSLIV